MILDACCNHLGNPNIMFQMIRIAESHGADYIKFQLYDSDSLNHSYPNFRDTRERLKASELDALDTQNIIEFCRVLNITPTFTIFNEKRIEWLAKYYDAKFAIKVASPDMSNRELINKLVKTFPNKTIFISCGMHSGVEIVDAIDHFRQDNIRWLYCESIYPTPLDAIDYEKMKDFDGFSDHTVGLKAIYKAVMAVPKLGYIEKHFTLSKMLPIKDKEWSVVPEDLEELTALVKYQEAVENYKNRWSKEVC